jgi:hypothetical protein
VEIPDGPPPLCKQGDGGFDFPQVFRKYTDKELILSEESKLWLRLAQRARYWESHFWRLFFIPSADTG